MSLSGPSVRVTTPAVGPTGNAPSARRGGPVGLTRIDEVLGRTRSTEFRPAGTGGEFSTSAQSNQLVATVEPPRDGVLLLDEASLSLEGNGQAEVHVGPRVFGPYTGAVDVAIPFDGAILPFGKRIRVLHQSTDGASTTTKVAVSGREV